MYLLPFLLLPFALMPGLRDYTLVQALAASLLASGLCLAGLRRPFVWRLRDLPWLLWPLFLFLRADPRWEFFSEYALQALVLFALAPWLLEEPRQGRFFLRGAALLGLLLLGVQILGIGELIHGSRHYALRSLFGQENVYQGMNVLAMVCAGWLCLVQGENRFWKALAALQLLLGLLSLYGGDGFRDGTWGVSAGDCIALQLALPVGLFAAGGLYMARSKGLPVRFALLLGGVLLLLMALLPLLLLALPVWKASMPSSITSRLTLWGSIFEMAKAYPWGVGIGGMPVYLYDFWPGASQALFPASTYYNVAHNHHWHYLAETGFAGYAWSVALWALPSLACIRRYMLGGERLFLYLSGVLMGWQAAMVLLEITQLFMVAQLGAWGLLLTAWRLSSASESTRGRSVSGAWLLLLLPLLGSLAWDRYTQLKSWQYTVHLELGASLQPEDLPRLEEALRQHGKNPVALYFSAELARRSEDWKKASLALEGLEEMGEIQSAYRLKALLYKDQRQDSLACRYAWRKLRYSADKQDLLMHAWADSCPLAWRRLEAQ